MRTLSIVRFVTIWKCYAATYLAGEFTDDGPLGEDIRFGECGVPDPNLLPLGCHALVPWERNSETASGSGRRTEVGFSRSFPVIGRK